MRTDRLFANAQALSLMIISLVLVTALLLLITGCCISAYLVIDLANSMPLTPFP